jgi:hypothetical protein
MFLGTENGLNEVISIRLREGHQHFALAQYRDLHVNKAQALGFWPNPGQRDDFIRLHHGMSYAYQELRQVDSWWSHMVDRQGSAEKQLNYLAKVFCND